MMVTPTSVVNKILTKTKRDKYSKNMTKDEDEVIVVGRDKRTGIMVQSDVIPRKMVSYFKYIHHDMDSFRIKELEKRGE